MCTNRPSALELIMSMSEHVVRSLAPRADFEIDRQRGRSVDHVMAVAGVLGKGCAIAGAQHRLAAIFDQRHFAFEHEDKFIFVRMPVALARPIAWRQVHKIDAEIVSPPALPSRCRTRSAQGASNGGG